VPATINGIGTHYYGAGNRSARVDTCKQCGRSATLSSYDTREWFCIVFIPIIPMRKFRILNDCSSCRKHYRLSQDEFAKKLAEQTAPIKHAIRSTPSDPQPRIELVRTLIGWEMRADAAKELDAAIAAFPQNVNLIAIAGQLAVDQNQFERAVSLYERGYAIDPQDGGVTYGYAWVLQNLERYDKAIPILQKAMSQDFNRNGALYLLGKSHMKLSHWNEALNSFQSLLAAEPKYQKDKALLRLVRDCKQHLGYELTDAERRAGRRWWPFGGGARTKRAALQPQPTLVRPGLRWAGLAIVVIMILSSGVYLWDRWTNLEVYFDNSFDRAVKVEVGGRNFDIAQDSLHKEEMNAGSYIAIVRGKDGKEIERLTFSLEKMNPVAAAMHDRFFLFNIGGRHIYRRANHGYARNAENSSYNAELIAMQRFIEQRDVDYPFMAPPKSIEANASSTVVHKVSFDVAKDLDLRKYALVRLQEGKTNEAKAAIEKAVSSAPCDAPTRRAQLYLASLTGTFETASKTAQGWIADCSQDDLEAHRAYQDLNRENGRQAALREDYQKQLSSSPQSGKAHYLYGRVLADPQAAIVEYQQAIQLDPALIWPRVALGHAYQAAERYDDAIHEFSEALDMKGCDPSVIIYYANAAIAKGQPEAALDKVEEVRKGKGRDINALHARWLLATASAQWDRAVETEKLLEPLENPETGWWRTTKRMRFKQDSGLDGRIDGAMRAKELKPIALDLKIERLIENGDFAQSADLIAKNSKDLDPTGAALLEAYTAGGYLLQNDPADANKLLDDAEKTLASAQKGSVQRVTVALVQGLRGTMPVAWVMGVARENDALAHGWFVDAVRAAQAGDRARASASLAHCARATADLDFPYLEAKAMAARIR